MITTRTTARLRGLRMSPRKVRLMIDLVRGMKAEEAVAQLRFSPKVAARPVMKLVQSAIANAVHNHDIDRATLKIVESFVDGGPTMYRFTPRAMGRSAPIRKRTSHITVVLEGTVTTKEKSKKEEKVKEEKVVEKEI